MFNHMANMRQFQDLDFPGIDHTNFHPPCPIDYADGTRTTELVREPWSQYQLR